MANVIERLQKPTLALAHSYRTCHWQLLPHAMANKRLTAQLYGEFREMFPENAVEYFVS